jgi:hypothetical protein
MWLDLSQLNWLADSAQLFCFDGWFQLHGRISLKG